LLRKIKENERKNQVNVDILIAAVQGKDLEIMFLVTHTRPRDILDSRTVLSSTFYHIVALGAEE